MILVVFIFLGSWRATLIPLIAVPVALVGTFAFLLLIGFSANTISLLAVVLAIGIVVDDAIVVVENVERIMEEDGFAPAAARQKAMGEIAGPIIAITLVLLSVFVPVAFIPGITGQLFQQFAAVVAFSMLDFRDQCTDARPGAVRDPAQTGPRQARHHGPHHAWHRRRARWLRLCRRAPGPHRGPGNGAGSGFGTGDRLAVQDHTDRLPARRGTRRIHGPGPVAAGLLGEPHPRGRETGRTDHW